MKIKFFYVLFIFPIYLISQSTISGSVIDENKKPIPFCNVILINTLNDQNFGDKNIKSKKSNQRNGSTRMQVGS